MSTRHEPKPPGIREPAFLDTQGSARLVRRNGQVDLVIDATGLPETRAGTAYGVWLTNASTGKNSRFLGFVASQPRHGRITAQAPLTRSMIHDYSSVELTIEHTEKPMSRPGTIVLHGTLP